MYCSGSAFFCGNAGCSDCGNGGSQSCADFLCGIYEFAQLSVSVLAGVGGFFRGGVVGTNVTLHAVENCLRIVQLYLPALGSSVILAE